MHRRFVWQALLAYLVFARIAFEVVTALLERKSLLPHSFTVVAIVLLIVGLPIIVITAYVQHGIPSVGRSDPTLQVEVDGDGQSVKAQPTPRGVRKAFTWRNAMLIGVAAFTLWALAAAAWLMLAGDLLDKVNEREREEAVQAEEN
ncbi:MAG: hypothetical protein JSW46_08720 [Gemmatimonadota bacterium]|nr:MAG: hypothetical protein JSW46_08720 [Gemmatimonadota bacterium]